MSDIGWLKDIIYILPLAALIWKAASLAAEQKLLRKEVDYLKAQIRTDIKTALENLDKCINEVKISVVRIETKLEAEDEN